MRIPILPLFENRDGVATSSSRWERAREGNEDVAAPHGKPPLGWEGVGADGFARIWQVTGQDRTQQGLGANHAGFGELATTALRLG